VKRRPVCKSVGRYRSAGESIAPWLRSTLFSLPRQQRLAPTTSWKSSRLAAEMRTAIARPGQLGTRPQCRSQGRTQGIFEGGKRRLENVLHHYRETPAARDATAQTVLKECLSRTKACGALKQPLSTKKLKHSQRFLELTDGSSRKLPSQSKARWSVGAKF